MAPADVAYPKAIKSFVRRAGRTTTGQAKAFEDLGHVLSCPTAANCWTRLPPLSAPRR